MKKRSRASAWTCSSLYAQKTCYSELKGDTLVIGNECIERKFIWNDGNLVTYSLSDKANRKTTFTVKQAPDFFISKDTREASKGACRVEKVAVTDILYRGCREDDSYILFGNIGYTTDLSYI